MMPMLTAGSETIPMSALIKSVVLIVEDELPQMEMLAYNLSKEGFEVLKAPDGEEALLLVEEVAV